jgi:hypothetical protein
MSGAGRQIDYRNPRPLACQLPLFPQIGTTVGAKLTHSRGIAAIQTVAHPGHRRQQRSQRAHGRRLSCAAMSHQQRTTNTPVYYVQQQRKFHLLLTYHSGEWKGEFCKRTVFVVSSPTGNEFLISQWNSFN